MKEPQGNIDFKRKILIVETFTIYPLYRILQHKDGGWLEIFIKATVEIDNELKVKTSSYIHSGRRGPSGRLQRRTYLAYPVNTYAR